MTVYTEANVKRRLYNAGDRISECMHYSLPDGHDVHCVARYMVEAPEKDFFEIPTTILINDARIDVRFLETILRPDRFGGRGVIVVDANWKAPEDSAEAELLPVAASDKDAIAKGDRHWKSYVQKVAQQWIDQCQQVRATGGVPLAASGFVVRALKMCGIVDPAQAVVITAGENKTELEKLRQDVADLKKLLGKNGDEPEPEKAATGNRKPGGSHQPAANVRAGK
jgi:hypothetical protein